MLNYKFLKELEEFPFVEAIYLFGSRARADNDPGSDIDLAIECPSATEKDWLAILELVDEADTLLKIDCIRYDKIDNQELLDNINKQKKILFKRD